MGATDDPDEALSAVVEGAVGAARRHRHGWEIDLSAGRGRLDVASATELLTRLCAQIAATGGGTARWRVPVPTPEHRRIAEGARFEGRRALVQMRRPLPAPPPEPPLPTRPFVAGVDDDEWLRVNNAAFSWHPEQGGWSRADLAERVAEPWFDPSGFRVHPADDTSGPGGPIDGFCWTKVHHETEPPVGEIFVIAVDPVAAGTGLGRRLVLAGLEHLTTVGVEEAMLYTEADNIVAVGLYRALEFTTHHEVRVFERRVEPQTPTPTSAPIP